MQIKINSDAIGDLGFNVVTSTPLEQLMDYDNNDKHLYINAYTLYRNFVSCLDGSNDDKLRLFKSRSTLDAIFKLFIEDTLTMVNAAMTNNIKVTVYELDYTRMSKIMGNFKTPMEFKGLKYYIATTQDAAVNKLKNNIPGIYKKYGPKLPYEKNMFIITHIGLDLLPLRDKKDVILIESHTGDMKDNNMWYTKLKKFGKYDMSIIPFNEVTYRIFGDKEFVKSESIATKRFVYEIAKKLGWYQGLNPHSILSAIMRNTKTPEEKKKFSFKLFF